MANDEILSGVVKDATRKGNILKILLDNGLHLELPMNQNGIELFEAVYLSKQNSKPFTIQLVAVDKETKDD